MNRRPYRATRHLEGESTDEVGRRGGKLFLLALPPWVGCWGTDTRMWRSDGPPTNRPAYLAPTLRVLLGPEVPPHVRAASGGAV